MQADLRSEELIVMVEDPLASLVVDGAEIARTDLADALAPFVRFTREGELLLQEAFDGIPSIQRVACLLLAYEAARLLGFRSTAGASPQDLVTASGMPGGTVRPKLSELVDSRLAVREGRSYTIAPHALHRVARQLREAVT